LPFLLGVALAEAGTAKTEPALLDPALPSPSGSPLARLESVDIPVSGCLRDVDVVSSRLGEALCDSTEMTEMAEVEVARLSEGVKIDSVALVLRGVEGGSGASWLLSEGVICL
jgi:hypothetical protein